MKSLKGSSICSGLWSPDEKNKTVMRNKHWPIHKQFNPHSCTSQLGRFSPLISSCSDGTSYFFSRVGLHSCSSIGIKGESWINNANVPLRLEQSLITVSVLVTSWKQPSMHKKNPRTIQIKLRGKQKRADLYICCCKKVSRHRSSVGNTCQHLDSLCAPCVG